MSNFTTLPDWLRPDPVGNLADGSPVYEKVEGSHLDEHADARPLVEEALSKITPTAEELEDGNGFFVRTVEMGRIVGTSSCVATSDSDDVVYAMRVKNDGSPARAGFTRFVRGREPVDSTKMAVLAYRHSSGEFWVLVTSWVGRVAEKEPWDNTHDDDSYAAAVEFWSAQALCFDGSNPVNDTLVTSNPDFIGYFDRRIAPPKESPEA